jgi:hypothetical protein
MTLAILALLQLRGPPCRLHFPPDVIVLTIPPRYAAIRRYVGGHPRLCALLILGHPFGRR